MYKPIGLAYWNHFTPFPVQSLSIHHFLTDTDFHKIFLRFCKHLLRTLQ